MQSSHCAGCPRFDDGACAAARPTFLGSDVIDLLYWADARVFLRQHPFSGPGQRQMFQKKKGSGSK